MTYPIISIPDDAGDSIEQRGTKRKFWFDGNRRLFKQGRPGTGENWAEKVSAEVCALLGLPHAGYELAVWRGLRGVVTDSFVPEGVSLGGGNEVLSKLYPQFRMQQRYQQRQHTVRVFLALGTGSRIELPRGYDGGPTIKQPADLMLGYLMLDCLIGNQDRHDENWGFVGCPEDGGRVSLAPTFDNASSLGRNESDDKRLYRLRTRDRGATVPAFAAKACSAFYAGSSAVRTLTILEAFQAGARMRRAAVGCWLEVLEGLRLDVVQGVFRQIPGDWISEPAIEFALAMIQENRNRLLEADRP